jgi:hypothetical protein
MSEAERKRGEHLLKNYFGAKMGRGGRKLYSSSLKQEYSPLDLWTNTRYEVEESHDLHLTRADYERLTGFLGYDPENKDYYSPGDKLHTYERDVSTALTAERKMREDHPSVQLAYEKYRFLLDMVANGKKIED